MAELPPSAAEVGLPDDVIVVYPAGGQTLYRILAGGPPTIRDFQSHLERGEKLRRRQPAVDFAGVSMFASADQAEGMAMKFPKIGRSIAAVVLDGPQVSLARTGLTPGHYTIWARPEPLLEAAEIVAVIEG